MSGLERLQRAFGYLLWAMVPVVLLLCVVIARLVVAPLDLDFARDRVLQEVGRILPGWQLDYERARLAWDWRSVGPMVQVDAITARGYDGKFVGAVPELELVLPARSLLGFIDIRSIRINNARLDLNNVSEMIERNAPMDADAPIEAPMDAPMDAKDTADAAAAASQPFRSSQLIPAAKVIARIANQTHSAVPNFRLIEFDNLELWVKEADELTRVGIPILTLRRDMERAIVIDSQIDVAIGDVPVHIRARASAVPGFDTKGAQSGGLIRGGAHAPTPADYEALAVTEAADGTLTLDLPQMGTRSTLELEISNILIPDFRDHVPLSSMLQAFNIPLSATVALSLNPVQGLAGAEFSLDLGEGALEHPSRYPEPAPVRFGVITGRYDSIEERILLDRMVVDIGDSVIEGDGSLFWEDGASNPSGQLNARLAASPIANVVRYWPIARLPDGRPRGAREWIARNMIGGFVGNIDFKLGWDRDGKGLYRDDSLIDLSFDFWDLESYLLSTMPPLKAARGSATLLESSLSMEIEEGVLNDLPVSRSRALIDGMNIKGGTRGYFHIHTEGDVATLLDLVDYRPVRISKKIKTDLSRFRGQGEVFADLTVPLTNYIQASDVVYDVDIYLKDFEFDDLLGGEGLRDGDLHVSLVPESVEITGRGKVNDVEADFVLVEDLFTASRDLNALTSEISVKGSFQASELAQLGVEVTRWAEGPLTGAANFRGRAFQPQYGSFTADVGETVITISELGWQKPTGVPASLKGELVFPDVGQVLVNQMQLKNEGLDAVLDMGINTLGPGSLTLDAVVREMGQHSLRASLIRESLEAPIDLKVDATRFDLRPFIGPQGDAIEKNRDGEDEQIPPINLSVDAAQVLLLNGETFSKTEAEIAFREGEPKAARIDGILSRSGLPIVIEVAENQKDPKGPQVLEIQSKDAGGILRGMGYFAHVMGGDLDVVGTTSGWGDGLKVDIMTKVREATVLRFDELEGDIQVGGIEATNDFIDKGGLRLKKADVPLSFHEGLLDFEEVVANGPSLGITLEGQIHAERDKININGVVIPAYRLNSLLGNIPLLGTLLTGGEGEGVFAVPYRVKGSLTSPEVDVSTASALAPGILRKLFEGSKGTIEDMEREEAEKKAEDAEKERRKKAKQKEKEEKMTRRNR